MTAKKFSLKDSPIFKSTVVPRPEGSKKIIPSPGVIHPQLVKEKEQGLSLSRERVKKEGEAVAPVGRNKVWLKNKVLMAAGAIFLSLIIAGNIKFFSQRIKEGGYLLPGEAEVKEEIVQDTKLLDLLPEKDLLLLPGQAKPERVLLPTPPPEERISAIEAQKRREEKKWSLTAILFSEVSSQAIINHEIVREGDTLWGGKVKVIKIMPEKVILSREGETFTLRVRAINHPSGRGW